MRISYYGTAIVKRVDSLNLCQGCVGRRPNNPIGDVVIEVVVEIGDVGISRQVKYRCVITKNTL